MLRIPVSLDVHLHEAESVEGQPKKGVKGAVFFGRLVDWSTQGHEAMAIQGQVMVSLGNGILCA